MITFFNDKAICGLLWGKYPREMSIIGDRIISKFLINNFKMILHLIIQIQ